MSAKVIRCDYEKMAQLAQAFREHADCNRQALERIKRQAAVLQNGDWVGKGASAFYEEMDALVQPSLLRLVKALESAADVAARISQVMQQGEDEAARLLRAQGSAIPAGAAAGIAAGLAAGGVGGAFGEPAAGVSALGEVEYLAARPPAGGPAARGAANLPAQAPDPFPNIRQRAPDQYDEAMRALADYRQVERFAPYYYAVNALAGDISLGLDERGNLAWSLAGQASSRATQPLWAQMGQAATEGALETFKGEVVDGILGELGLGAAGAYAQSLLALKDIADQVRNEKLVGGVGPEAEARQQRVKLAIAKAIVAQAAASRYGMSVDDAQAAIWNQYNRFEPRYLQWQRYQYLDENLSGRRPQMEYRKPRD